MFWTAVVIVGAAACGNRAAPRFTKGVLATPVVRVPLELAQGEDVEIEARAVHGPGRPVMHLWEPSTAKELARAAAGRWHDSPSVHYRNQNGKTQRVELLVRSDRAGASGQVDLLRKGKLLLRAASFGGALLDLKGGSDITYLVAATPGAPAMASLWGLDAQGRIRAYASDGAPTGLPQLASHSQIKSLLLAPLGASSGRFNVYANDADDRDGDGLGRRLEHALGLCDSVAESACGTSLLADFYRSVATGTRDSDRDGVSDADELWGARGPGLDLPRYGADPRHKDVFIEVDHHRNMPDVGLNERELSELSALYAVGAASDLKNPDGLPGVRLHFDVGVTPTRSEHAALFGDWGGSGRAQASEYRAARAQDFTPSRAGYFRYAFMTRRGRGQAKRDAFTVNRDLQRVNIFAHELGHTLGLEHHGHDSWGERNCKPNYYSIMNYLYQYRYEVGFSRRTANELNPASVLERGALARLQDAAWLREPPLELDVSGHDVDWNRDGVISDVALRANLLWSTFRSCAASEAGRTTLASEHVAATTPVLISTGRQLVALWLDDSGKLWTRRRERTNQLESWSTSAQVQGLENARHIAGVALEGERVALVYVLQDESVHLATLSFADHIEISEPRAHVLFSTVIEGAHTRNAPAIAVFELEPRFYGTQRALGVLFRSSTSGRIEQAFARLRDTATMHDANGTTSVTPASEGPFVRKAALDDKNNEIRGLWGPGVTVLPSAERCAVFPDADSFIRFYCYDPQTDRWLDLTAQAFEATLGPSTGDAAGLAYHYYRDASGEPVTGDGSRGALYLAFSEPAARAALYPDNPHFYVSEWLSAGQGAREQISFRWRGRLVTEWTQVATGTGVALHDSGDHLQALMVLRTGTGALRLDYLPHADGEVDEALNSGNDFQVMERGVCLGIRSETECGGVDTGRY